MQRSVYTVRCLCVLQHDVRCTLETRQQADKLLPRAQIVSACWRSVCWSSHADSGVPGYCVPDMLQRPTSKRQRTLFDVGLRATTKAHACSQDGDTCDAATRDAADGGHKHLRQQAALDVVPGLSYIPNFVSIQEEIAVLQVCTDTQHACSTRDVPVTGHVLQHGRCAHL